MAKQLQLRRGNLSWWTTNNPVLADGEMVLVSTTNDYVYDQYRIGDGLNTFSSLAIHSFPFNTTIEQFLADAEAARDAAQLAETNAETAETNAEAAEALAEKWATNPENVVVESGKYSALHWSAKAEDEKLAAEVFKNKADKFANESEDVEVESGKYSAKHYSLKAAASAAGIADSAEMLIKHEAEIASLENTINSANINQETTATVSGVDTVALPKTAANTGMQVQLFGQSAQNLVVNGDFRNGTVNPWETGPGAASPLSLSNSIASFTTGIQAGYARYGFGARIINDIYYTKALIKADSSLVVFRLFLLSSPYTNVFQAAHSGSNQFESLSGRASIPTNGNYAIQVQDNRASGWTPISFTKVLCVNLTATFGAGNEPTKEQCDLLFANYFEGSDNVLGAGRVRSVGKNLFDKNATPIQKTGPVGLEATANGIRVYTLSNSAFCIVRYKVSVEKGATYRLSAFVERLLGGSGSNTIYVTREISGNGLIASAASTGQVTLSINSVDVSTVYILFYATTGVSQESNILYSNIQLERASTATAYEPYRPSSLYLTTPELRSNGLIKDEIRKGTNGYELVKRVGVGTLGAHYYQDFEGTPSLLKNSGDEISTFNLNTTSPISGTKDARVVVSVSGTNSSRPLCYLNGLETVAQTHYKVSFKYKVNSGTCILRNILFGSGGTLTNISPTTLTGSGTFTAVVQANFTRTDYLGLSFDGRYLFDIQIDDLAAEKISVTDGVPASGVLAIQYGSNVHYQLANPTITPIVHAGLLNSNSNGTVYFEPIIADAGVYSTNLAIQLTDYPISSFESIRKYANGTYTELDITLAQKAGDGLSFTHSGLNPGDLVMFTYAYANESIGRSMTLTYAISNSNPYYNVTNSVPLTTGYYTSTTARAAVPEGIRKTGLILTYETAAGVWYTERYIGTATDTTSWTTAGNWEIGVLRIAAVTDTTEYAEITI